MYGNLRGIYDCISLIDKIPLELPTCARDSDPQECYLWGSESRAQVEDYELLTMAAARLGREAVRAWIRPFVRSAWDFEDDHGVLQDVRASIGRSFSVASKL